MQFGQIFWPVLAAMFVSGVSFELFHFGLGMIITWRQQKRMSEMKKKIAEQMGVDPSELELMVDNYENGGDYPMNGFGGGPPNFTLPTASGENNSGHGHGQYL